MYDNSDDEDAGSDDATQHALRAIMPHKTIWIDATALAPPAPSPGRPLYRLVHRNGGNDPAVRDGYSVLSTVAGAFYRTATRLAEAHIARWERGSDGVRRKCDRMSRLKRRLEREEWDV